jgi:hypothetical protein
MIFKIDLRFALANTVSEGTALPQGADRKRADYARTKPLFVLDREMQADVTGE